MPLTVSRNGTVTTTLTYDGNGARAKKVVGGTTTYYVSSDYEIKNGVATKYVFAGNMRVASIEGTNIDNSKIFHKDHLGSSTAITDSTGADTETTEYMPFGVQRSHSGANTSDYKYTDQELDNESGLYNYYARMYDPVIGRFISADTIIQSPYNPQTLNRYSYCVNNPLIYVDPSGHVVIPGPLLQLALAMAKEEEAKREKAEDFRHGRGFNWTQTIYADPFLPPKWTQNAWGSGVHSGNTRLIKNDIAGVKITYGPKAKNEVDSILADIFEKAVVYTKLENPDLEELYISATTNDHKRGAHIT